jgi:DoxX-like family
VRASASSVLRAIVPAIVTAEWFHEGTWKKFLGKDPRHADIVASIPGLSASSSTILLRALGLTETVLGLWVLSRWRRREASLVQTALVIGMNAGGLVFAGDQIPNHKRLIARSAAFLALVWLAGSTHKHQ